MLKLEDQFLNDVFLTLSKYISESEKQEHVVKNLTADELKKLIPKISEEGVSSEELLKELQVILDHSVQTIHPRFLNQLFGGFDAASWAGDVASTLLNPTMAPFEMAPVLTVIEKRTVAELLKKVGYDQGEGIMVTGGSNSNLLGMLCARTEYGPHLRLTGFEHNRYRVYVSEEAHYSFDKAANITGIGTQNLILVPANENGEMIPEQLEKIISADIRDGYKPLMVGATLGSTVLGAFDPLRKIAKICDKYQIWLHADAAWGGGALFSTANKQLVDGLELADSVTFDAHKTMGSTLITSFFLTKHPGILRNTNRGGGAEYLFHDYENSDWDTGTYSLQCGRRADVLKFWLLLRAHGMEGITKRTDHLFALAEYAKELLEKEPRFKLYHANYLNVCFQIL